jgi:cob(I)alamin adenosyltransferase
MFEENKESFRYKTEKRIESLETAVKSMQEALEKLKQFVGYKQ